MSNLYFESNKKLWNSRVVPHVASEFYNVRNFLKGESAIQGPELEEIGELKGKELLHLQCHFGMDTLSLAREGAKVTGIDFSEDAIAQARKLSDGTGIPADFICANVYELQVGLKASFDVVFTSYGSICWLPDINKWAEVIAYYLKPGGMFYIIDFHPLWYMLDFETLEIKYSYFNTTEPITEEVSNSYTDNSESKPMPEHTWNHAISEIIDALLKAGLQITAAKEYDYFAYNCFPNSIAVAVNKWQVKGLEGKLPLMYSIKTVKLMQQP